MVLLLAFVDLDAAGLLPDSDSAATIRAVMVITQRQHRRKLVTITTTTTMIASIARVHVSVGLVVVIIPSITSESATEARATKVDRG